MKRALAVAAVAIAAGCASVGSQDYSKSEARVVQTVSYGTVESVRTVRITEDKPIVGTVAGAVGGGIAGNAIERKVSAEDGQEIVVRLDNGTSIAVVQPGVQGFEAGQRVRVLSGPKGSRVEQG